MSYKHAQLPGSWVYDLPLIGDDFAKIGRIQQLYGAQCSPTAEIWVYAFFQQIPTMFISLKKPELIDINIHHRRGKPRKAKKLKFGADFILRDALIEIPVPRWVVFRVWELGQRIGYYFLVADVAENGAINWMTLAYKNQGCQLPDFTYLRTDGHHLLTGGFSGPQNYILPTTVDGVSHIEVGPGHFGLIRPGQYSVKWTATFEPYGDPAQSQIPYSTALIDHNTGQPIEIGENSAGENGKYYTSGVSMITLESGRADFDIIGQFAGSGVCWCDLKISVDLMDENEIAPDP